MLIIENRPYYDAVVAFASKVGLYEPPEGCRESAPYLKNRLDYLATYGGKDADGADRMRVRLLKDFAPHSFELVIETRTRSGEWEHFISGGLIFHGSHDGNGSGGAPTLAVTVTATTGWSIHT
jgi:hypothetical protein